MYKSCFNVFFFYSSTISKTFCRNKFRKKKKTLCFQVVAYSSYSSYFLKNCNKKLPQNRLLQWIERKGLSSTKILPKGNRNPFGSCKSISEEKFRFCCQRIILIPYLKIYLCIDNISVLKTYLYYYWKYISVLKIHFFTGNAHLIMLADLAW